MYSNYFTEIIPYAGYDIKQIAWHECMACGNGHIGIWCPKKRQLYFSEY